MSKRRLPKPVRGINKLIGGIPYFQVVVSLSGTMHLSNIFKIKGQPYSILFRYFGGKALFVNTTTFGIFGRYNSKKSLHDSGIIKEEDGEDNFHRTFCFNAKDYEFCKQLVDRQDLSTYKKLFIR